MTPEQRANLRTRARAVVKDNSGRFLNSAADGAFIAAANPIAVLDLLDALDYAEKHVPPCDGGCNYVDGPEETCSRHGRPPAELWALLNEERTALNAAGQRIAELELQATEAEADYQAATTRPALE